MVVTIKCAQCGQPADGIDYVPVLKAAGKGGIAKQPKCRAHVVGKGGLVPFPWAGPPPEPPPPPFKPLSEGFLNDVMAQYDDAIAGRLGTDMLASMVPVLVASYRKLLHHVNEVNGLGGTSVEAKND